jgi:hypothetical protein
MSYHPTIGGRLREEASGVDRSQAASLCWGSDPVKEIGQTASCAPFCPRMIRDGRLRREPDTEQSLRLPKNQNRVVVDKTS